MSISLFGMKQSDAAHLQGVDQGIYVFVSGRPYSRNKDGFVDGTNIISH